MSDNPKKQGAWNVPVLLETIERNRRERDEARRWARHFYDRFCETFDRECAAVDEAKRLRAELEALRQEAPGQK